MIIRQPFVARYADYVPVFPKRYQTPAQKAGLRYEAAIKNRLSGLHEKLELGPWFYYKTRTKSGICQPDILVWLTPDLICVVECKLTWQRGVRDKLRKFYGPIIGEVHQADLCYLQVYKNTKTGAHKHTVSLYELDTLKPGEYKECQHII